VKRGLLLPCLLMLGVWTAAANPEPEIQYFKQVREVSIPKPDRQTYVVVDTAIWTHARPDLSDLRLYDGGTQIPYQLVSENASTTTQEVEAKMLNLAQHGDHAEFDLDVSPVTEYNRIRLAIDRKDFVITASVAGGDMLGGVSTQWPSPSTLFDFSRENLGSNSTIALPLWSFRYVHVRLSPGIFVKDVKQATVSIIQEKKAAWTDAGTCRSEGELKHISVFTCDVPTAIPVGRIQFDIPADRVNFRRQVTIVNEKGMQLAAGNISRVRINRAGATALSEDLTANVFGDYTGRLTVNIDNGDDPPLPIRQIRPQSVERRLCFEPQGKTSLRLYYGDEKLAAPVYDYAKLFHEDASATPAQLGSETANASYTTRPDERPWSEKHKAVLWAAMLLAVAVLGSLAFRGLKTETQRSG
jgi:uncharacterized protein DUF3999